MDVGVPIVFTAFLITAPEEPVHVDLIPFTDVDDYTIYPRPVSDLGHAGVLLINGTSGLTRYYEYGRYGRPERRGRVQRPMIPNVEIGQDGRPTRDSLANTLRSISNAAGQGGPVSGAWIEVEDGFGAMENRAEYWRHQNTDPERREYDLFSWNCLHFAVDVVEAGGVRLPWIVTPRPIGYLGLLRLAHPDIEYDPRSREVTVEGIHESRSQEPARQGHRR